MKEDTGDPLKKALLNIIKETPSLVSYDFAPSLRKINEGEGAFYS